MSSRVFPFLSLLLLVVCFGADLKAQSKKGAYTYDLKAHLNKENVLLVFAPSKKSEKFKKQLEALRGRDGDFRRANIVLYYVFENEEGRADDLHLRTSDAGDLRRAFDIEAGSFKILLIDKAGKLKKQGSQVLSLAELNAFLGLKSKS